MASDRVGNHWMIGFFGGTDRLAKFIPILDEVFVGPPTDFPANSNLVDALAFHPDFGLYVVRRRTGFTINFPWEVRVDWIFWQV